VRVSNGASNVSSQQFFATHSMFTHEEFVRSRDGGSPCTVDSLLRKHAARGRIDRMRVGKISASSARTQTP